MSPVLVAGTYNEENEDDIQRFNEMRTPMVTHNTKMSISINSAAK